MEISAYPNLLMNSLLVSNLLIGPPSNVNYQNYNDLIPKIVTTESPDYKVDISPEAYKLSIIDGLLPVDKWQSSFNKN